MIDLFVNRGPSQILLPAETSNDPANISSGSWLGGRPRLNESFDWPHDGAGHPMWFSAQIDLSHVHPEAWRGKGPRAGWLVIFVSNQGAKVLHVEALGPERAPPKDTPELGAFSSRHKAQTEWARSDVVMADGDQQSGRANQIGGLPEPHAEGCWPLFDDLHLKNLREGRLAPYMPKVDPPFDKMNHLVFQITAGFDRGWSWSEHFRVSLVVSEQDLASCRFDRVLMRPD